MKMNNGDEADQVIHVDITGQKGTPQYEGAHAEGLVLARKGKKVLLLVHAGTYSLSQTLELHPNLHTRGVGPDDVFNTPND